MPELLKVSEVAIMLQVTPVTVHNLIKRGHFPGAHKLDPTRKNSHTRIPKAEVEAYIQSIQPQQQQKENPD